MVEVAAEWGRVGTNDILSKDRRRNVARLRFAISWALKQYGWSGPRIATLLRLRDHTSVIYHWRRANQLRETSPNFKRLTDLLVDITADRSSEAA